MLECRGLSVRYGQHQALHEVGIRTAPGEIVVILGANGAGKSTLLQAIAGYVPFAASSQVLMNGQSVAHLPPHRIVQAGISLVPEGRRVFGELTVEENLLLGAYARRAREQEREHLQQVFTLFPRLAERRGQVVRNMSGGEQQMVAIGRAVMSAPAILMLDEPSLGLSPLLTTELFRTLGEVRKSGVGILLVEQNARQGLAIADRGYLLENGRIVGEDTAARLAQDSAVQSAYLGGAGAKVGAKVPVALPAAPRPGASRPPDPEPAASQPTVSWPAVVPATPPAAPRLPSAPSAPASAQGTTADVLAARSIAELVQQATDVHARHVADSRPRMPAPPVAPATQSPPSELPATDDIADLVNRATDVHARHIASLRTHGANGPAAPTPAVPRAPEANPVRPVRQADSHSPTLVVSNGAGGRTLAQALAEIEAAAARARSRPPERDARSAASLRTGGYRRPTQFQQRKPSEGD